MECLYQAAHVSAFLDKPNGLSKRHVRDRIVDEPPNTRTLQLILAN